MPKDRKEMQKEYEAAKKNKPPDNSDPVETSEEKEEVEVVEQGDIENG